jgi:hypothetical protein
MIIVMDMVIPMLTILFLNNIMLRFTKPRRLGIKHYSTKDGFPFSIKEEFIEIGEEFTPKSKKTIPKPIYSQPNPTPPSDLIANFYPVSPETAEQPAASNTLSINFDSGRYVDILMQEGFTETEANGLITLIAEVVEGSMQNATRQLVTKQEQKKYLAQSLRELKLIRTDVQNLCSKDFANLKGQIDGIKEEVERTKQSTANDLTRVQYESISKF